MNYVQLFANGGKTSDQDLIKGIQKILGVDDTQMEQLLQIGINKYGSLEGIGQALNEATQGLTPNSSPEEVQAAVASVFSTNEPSQMFKCGGKLQQLVTKFGKGGRVDCGCGGTKLQEGGRTISADGSITIVNPNTAQADTLGRYSYPSTNGKFQLLSNGERNATVWDNTGGFPIARYANETFMQNHPVRTFLGGYKKAPAGYFENLVDRVNNRFDENGIPTKQEGGIVYTDLPGYDVDTRLTRRQARELARVNGMSENNEQFSLAMANAMNAARAMGLRGQEARQRAREMAAGIKPTERSIVDKPTQLNVSAPVLNTPAAITVPEQLVLPETQRTLDTLLAETNSGLARSLNRSRSLNNKSQQEARSLTDKINALFNKKHPDIVVGPIEEGFTVESSTNPSPVSTTSEETNNSDYYRPSNEELERRQQRWNYWNKPINRPQYQAIDETYEATPGYARTDYTTRLNEYFNRPAGNWNYQPIDETQNMSGYYNGQSRNNSSRYISTRPLIVPAGGGSYSWMQFKQGGQIVSAKCGKKLSCGGKPKAKDGVKLSKCGKKVKKGRNGLTTYYPAKNNKDLNSVQVENLYFPNGNMTLLTQPSKVGERRDSMFVYYSPNERNTATRVYKTFYRFKDGPLNLNENASSVFDRLRSIWNQNKIKADKIEK